MIIRQTTPAEKRRTRELFAIAFEYPLDVNIPQEPASAGVHCWAAFDEASDEMMSMLSVMDFQMNFDGNSCQMGGIGDVATLPQYRRRGGIRGCFEASLPWMYEHGYDFSYLYPFSTVYYRKFGYECCVQKMTVSLHLGLLQPAAVEGRFALAEQQNPMTDEIRQIDRILEKRFNGMVCHSDDFYAWTKKQNPAVTQEFTYVYFDRCHTPKAYTTFRKQDQPDGRNLVCRRFQFVDREGFNGLMQLFKSLSADHMYAKFQLPVHCSMEYLFPEWSLGAVQTSLENAGMIRVVHVENALRKAAYRGSGSITLQIQDPQIPQNNAVFHILFENGQAKSVERTDGAPDAVLSIPAFSALLAGTVDFSDAAMWMSGIEIQNSQAPFRQIFYRKPLMICDPF